MGQFHLKGRKREESNSADRNKCPVRGCLPSSFGTREAVGVATPIGADYARQAWLSREKWSWCYSTDRERTFRWPRRDRRVSSAYTSALPSRARTSSAASPRKGEVLQLASGQVEVVWNVEFETSMWGLDGPLHWMINRTLRKGLARLPKYLAESTK